MTGFEHFFDVHTHHNSGAQLSITQFNPDSTAPPPSYFSVGIHPEQAQNELVFPSNFLTNIQLEQCLAIGEIGLDARYNNTQAQEIVYSEQLKLAKQFQKPVILHCVNRWDRCRFLHEKYASGIPIIYHGFNKPAIRQAVLAYKDAYISIGAAILTNEKLQQVVHELPLSRLLVETDTSNECIELIYQQLADLKSLPLREFSESIFQNVQGIFKL